MWTLLKHNWRHIVRTKLIFLLLGLALGMQLLALKVSFQGKIYVGDQQLLSWGAKESLFIALFVQLFIGTFLSVVYGLWIVPYLHQGQRNQLTFTLPIPKWKFPVAYGLTLLLLLAILHGAMLLSYGATFGFSALAPSVFPWTSVAVSLILETFAFLVVTFAFALGSMIIGPISTFFLGVFVIFVMQMSGVVFHINDLRQRAEGVIPATTARHVYDALPPVGELAYELWYQYSASSWERLRAFNWMAWILIFGGLFYLRLLFPSRSRSVVEQ